MTHPALCSLNPFIKIPSPAGTLAGLIPMANARAAVEAERRARPCPDGESVGCDRAREPFHPDMAALAVWLDEPPLFLRVRPTIRYADESRDLLAWFKVFFDRGA